MKKKNVVNLIRYHAEGNESGFREEAYAIANEFDAKGDYQLAEYVMALMSDANVLYTQNFDYESEFLEKINVAYAIANEFDAKGDYQLAEYVMALMSDANVLYTQNFDYESEFLEKINVDSTPLFLPDVISQELIGIANAINNKADVNKFLFEGAPGTGKTEAVKQLAKVLDREIYMVDFSAIIDSKLGQTQKNITALFKEINSFSMQDKVIFLFDEIDALALDRTNSNDLREMGRATSTLLKGLDNLSERAMVIATTNLFENFDKAVIRRFDYVINFNRYSRDDLIQISENLLDVIIKKHKGAEKNKRLFKKIIALYDILPYPGDLKNIIKTAVVFSNVEDRFDYFRRLYLTVRGKMPTDVKELQAEGFTVREIEILTGVSKSAVARELKEE